MDADRQTRRFLAALACLAVASAQVLAAGPLPGMKMHVFEDAAPASARDTALTVQAHDPDGASRKLKMVVFDAGATSVAEAPRQPVGRNLAIPADERAAPLDLDRGGADQDIEVRTYAELGYRNDEMRWNKAAPGGSPNILSELQWNNVHSVTLTGGSEIVFGRHWVGEGRISYGQITAGENQDSDYFFNDRRGEFSRSNNETDDGASVDISAALGYRFTVGDPRRAPFWRITPKMGLGFRSQQFNITNGFQTLPATGRFGGLDSTYEASWFGPWGGVFSELVFSKRFSLEIGAGYHWVDYAGTGHWNLREDLAQPISFKHSANGEGIVANATARLQLTPNWIMRLSVQYQHWLANQDGQDRMFSSSGGTLEMQLNEARWHSYGLNLGVEYAF